MSEEQPLVGVLYTGTPAVNLQVAPGRNVTFRRGTAAIEIPQDIAAELVAQDVFELADFTSHATLAEQLDAMTIPQLQAYAAARDIDIPSSPKQAIVDHLVDALDPDPAPAETETPDAGDAGEED